MGKTGRARCHGAATIVNAIAAGTGAGFGIALATEATVTLTNEPGVFTVTIDNDVQENSALAEACLRRVLAHCDATDYGAAIVTKSDIPISRGLKSSSTAANAIVLAALDALGESSDDMTVINLGVDAALDAHVTITGAFDDACAAYFGDAVVTDNAKRSILSRYALDDCDVIIHVPKRKIRKHTLDTARLKHIRPLALHAADLAFEKKYAQAMLVNGIAYGTALGIDMAPTVRALEAGAVSAGISGTGPATVILATPGNTGAVLDAVADADAEIIKTNLNNEKAFAL